MDATPFANLAASDSITSGFAFGNNSNNFCCIARNFHPLGWTPSTSSTSSSTSTTTTVVPSTTTSTSSSTSTSTTTIPVCSEGYLYDIELYSCEDCSLSGTGGLSNNQPLTINKWYYYPSLQAKVRIISFSQCFGFGVSIPDSSKKDTCAEVVCPTTTSTTTLPPIPFIVFTVEDLDFMLERLGITNPLDPEEWNIALDNWWGGGTNSAYTSVEITGNTVKLFGGLDTVSVISISSMGVTAFDTTSGLPSLTYLDLGDNKLTDFNLSVPLTSLLTTTIYLSSNNITTFDPIFPLPLNLYYLTLRNNQIEEFNPTLPLPSSLKYLILSNNILEGFNPSVPLPTGLENLDIGGNLIQRLATVLPDGLITLNVANNTLLLSIDLTTLEIGMTDLEAFGCALVIESVDELLNRAVALGFTSFRMDLSGGTSSCPSALGLADKATLISRGCAILTNICTTTTTTTAVPTTTTTTTINPLTTDMFISYTGTSTYDSIGIYNLAANTITPVATISGALFTDIAMTNTKLWVTQVSPAVLIKEYNITFNPWSFVFSRDISTIYPGSGLGAENNTTLIGTPTNSEIAKFDITGSSAVPTVIGLLPDNYGITGDIMLTATGKLICSGQDAGSTRKIFQFNYSNMALEVAVDITGVIPNAYGIAELGGVLYIFNGGGQVYSMGLNYPYPLTFIKTVPKGLSGAAQMVSACTVHLITTTTTTTLAPTTTTTTTCDPNHPNQIFIPSSVANWPTLTKTLSDTCGALACIQASSCSVNGAYSVWINHALPLLINDSIYSNTNTCTLFSDGFYIFNNGGGNIIIEVVNGKVVSFPTCPTTTTTSTTTVVSFTYNTSTFSCSDCSPIATGVQLPNNSMLLSINGWFYNPATGLKIHIIALLSSSATPPTSFINNDDSVGSCALVSCPTTTTTTTT